MMNGVQLAASIKELSPETPVVLLTGFGDEMLALGGGHPQGVNLVLGKPVSQADLRRAVCRAMEGPAALASVA
jgi:FixJ family two-component response regulator